MVIISLKNCISVNNEFYHSKCLTCSICNIELKKYICKDGYLRCVEHADRIEERLNCDICSLPIYSNIIQSSGFNMHENCFNCQHCHISLKKAEAKRLNGKPICQDCFYNMISYDTTTTTTNKRLSKSKSNSNTPRESISYHKKK